MRGILTNGNEGQNFLSRRKSMSRLEKAAHTVWKLIGKSPECRDKGVRTPSGGSGDGLRCLGKGPTHCRKPV